MSPDDLVGAWSLVDFTLDFSDDRPQVQPFGASPQGRIVYAASGHMSAVLSRSDRAPFSQGGLERGGHATTAQKAQAFDGYLSYAGRWHLEGDEVVHMVQLALNPDAVGQHLRRHAGFEDETLVLTYDLTARSGVTRHYRLTWRALTTEEN
ncbi:MAG: lipocalin-like domain-containing protein [Bradymonadia bacterium]